MSEDPKPNRFAAKVQQAEPTHDKQFRIKVGSLRRTTKDLRFARKEVAQEQARLETMRAENSDKVSQQENVIKEADMMIPHSQNRIRSSIKDVSDYLQKERANITDAELISEAEAVLQDAENALEEH